MAADRHLTEQQHGPWTFHASARTLLGRTERVRRGGFASQAAARRTRAKIRDRAGRYRPPDPPSHRRTSLDRTRDTHDPDHPNGRPDRAKLTVSDDTHMTPSVHTGRTRMAPDPSFRRPDASRSSAPEGTRTQTF